MPTALDIQRVLQFHNCITLMGSHGGTENAVKNMNLIEKAEHVETQLTRLLNKEEALIDNSVYRSDRSINTVTYAEVHASLDRLLGSEKLSQCLMPPHPQV